MTASAVRKRVTRLVAARLSALDRPADLVREDGLESLCQQTNGSEDRLRALLAGALFIASTEDSEHVGADHVLRAAALLEPDAADLEASAPPRPRWPIGVAAGGLAAAVLSIIASVEFAGGGRRAPVPVEIMASAPLAPPAAPRPTALHAVIPTLAAPGAMEADTIASSEVALPMQPPAAVIIRYTAGAPGASSLVESMARRLEAAGISPAFALAARGELTKPSISYFYDEDRPTAVQAAAAAGQETLPPRLMTPIEGKTLRPPGTIEISVP